MTCPYLHVHLSRKICKRIIEQGLDGELDDFDITHYCKGNPNYCFFFRSSNNRTQITRQPEEDEPTELIVDNEPNQLDYSSSKQSDKLFKLKRFFHAIA